MTGAALRASLRLAWLPVAALAVGWMVSLTPLHRQFSAGVDDTVQQVAAQPVRYDDVVLIDFDNASLEALMPQLGPWPYARNVHATLLEFLREAGARTVVFDVVFGEPRDGDGQFAQTLARRPDTILAAAAMRDRLEQPPAAASDLTRLSLPAAHGDTFMHWPSATVPTPALLAVLPHLGSLGVVTTSLDADGRLRRLPLLHEVNGRLLPSLALAPLIAEQPGATLNVEPRALQLGPHRWATDAGALVRVALPRNATDLPWLPASLVLGAALGNVDPGDVRQALAGRTVFIGISAFMGDQVATAQGQFAGAAVLAQVYGSLKRGDLLRPAPWPVALAIVAIGLLPTLLLMRRGRPAALPDNLAALLSLLTIAVAAVVLQQLWRLQVSPLLPMTAVAIGLLLTLLLQVNWAARANRDLRQAQLAADSANAAKSEFLAGVSHELRTPLHAVLGMADALAQTPLNTDQAHYVEVFRDAGRTLSSLIDDLLDLSRIEASRLNLDVQPFRIDALLQGQMALFKTRAAAKGLQLRWNVAEGVGPAVHGDQRRLAQILTNLVGNALKFTREGGVEVSLARQPDGLVHVQVRDTGIGIASSELDRVFEPFAQADCSVSRHFGGTGLGLSISKRLVSLMGGRIWAESTPAAGSTFHFTAQLPPADLAEVPALSPPTTPAPEPVAAAAPVHLLLVEDNEVNVMVIEAMLKGSPHTLDIASNGEAAIELFRQRRYGLVLMDVHMPGMDGYTATRTMRQIEAEQSRPATAIVALTAGAFDTDRRDSLAAGCTGHLTKPLGQRELLAAVAQHGAASRPDPAQNRLDPAGDRA